MASNYTKLTPSSFKERLTSGHYKNATGARRAVGKSEMTDDEKKKTYKMIDNHFPDAAKPAAKPVKTGAKRQAKPAAKATKAASKRTAARGKRTAKASSGSTRGSKAASEGAPAASQELADLQAGAHATRESLEGLASVAELDPDLDVKAHVRRGAMILQHSINRIGDRLGVAPDAPSASEADAAPSPPSGEVAGQ